MLNSIIVVDDDDVVVVGSLFSECKWRRAMDDYRD